MTMWVLRVMKKAAQALVVRAVWLALLPYYPVVVLLDHIGLDVPPGWSGEMTDDSPTPGEMAA
ncbi:MAG: hypothetical protein UY92_C0003G0050 [Candidatus Magasanikbacteria bacterium GW2011_GWA2_56_11]|uniref:Uncharacterized protein n=1 Tax=Candidatus Magasanikbacteria bacterium GW2011_GWA2_56_11 TaxID=1619044 RepID=A0A0G2BBD2_9BACT|nr:MAG: hypothetical protein UY92_C0003G0050 [Candidatus Magasanikbacteria bacterium GW2011_GWA2_56_11]